MEAVRKRTGREEIDQEGKLEEEVEQFFEIIRRFREARAAAGRIRSRPRADREEEEEGTTKRKRSGGWVPKFEREDFNADVEFAAGNRDSMRSSASVGGGGAAEEEEKTAGEGDGEKKSLDDRLDLKLTL